MANFNPSTRVWREAETDGVRNILDVDDVEKALLGGEIVDNIEERSIQTGE